MARAAVTGTAAATPEGRACCAAGRWPSARPRHIATTTTTDTTSGMRPPRRGGFAGSAITSFSHQLTPTPSQSLDDAALLHRTIPHETFPVSAGDMNMWSCLRQPRIVDETAANYQHQNYD